MRGLERKSHQDDLQQALDAIGQGDRLPLATWLRGHLLAHVMPFWEPLFDAEAGGLCTCVTDSGEVVSGDKWLWSQWRMVWVCARIFNTIESDPKWRDRALCIARFCSAHGWLEDEQGWALLVGRTGEVKRGYESIYVDAFAVYGMVELAAATGDRGWLQRAEGTAAASLRRMERQGDRLPHFPYPIESGTKPHGVPMIWSLKLAALAAATGHARWADASRRMLQEIDADFYDPDEDRVRENVWRDRSARKDHPLPAATVPGHVIEGLWFRRVAESDGVGAVTDPRETWRRLERHAELGWDKSCGGGLLLAVDARGDVATAGWPLADLKLWWPHTEYLVANLMAWTETGESGAWDRYRQGWVFAVDHFVDWENGEWRQKLNRDLSPFTGTVALPVKDPFHLPRSLILQIEMLESGRLPRAATRMG